jgi:hypothetical protein
MSWAPVRSTSMRCRSILQSTNRRWSPRLQSIADK